MSDLIVKFCTLYIFVFKEYFWINLGQNSTWCSQPNMTLYASINSKTNEIAVSLCDCIQGHVYYPTEERCYQPFRQGPCKPNEIFTPPVNSTDNPKCVENQCAPGETWFEKTCRKFGERHSCKISLYRNGTVFVNPNTMELECANPIEGWEPFEGRVSGLSMVQPGDTILKRDVEYLYRCPVKGTKRHYIGAC